MTDPVAINIPNGIANDSSESQAEDMIDGRLNRHQNSSRSNNHHSEESDRQDRTHHSNNHSNNRNSHNEKRSTKSPTTRTRRDVGVSTFTLKFTFFFFKSYFERNEKNVYFYFFVYIYCSL